MIKLYFGEQKEVAGNRIQWAEGLRAMTLLLRVRNKCVSNMFARLRMSQLYSELTVWPGATNSQLVKTWYQRKPQTCLVLGWLDLMHRLWSCGLLTFPPWELFDVWVVSVNSTLILGDDPWQEVWVIPGLLFTVRMLQICSISGHRNTSNSSADVNWFIYWDIFSHK